MTDVNDLVEAFKREVAIPGRFAEDFPTVKDSHITGLLADGFAEAQLRGLFLQHEYDPETEVIGPDLSRAGAFIVVLFAAIRMTRQAMSAESSNVRYKAGPVEMEQSKYSNVITTVYKSLQDRLDRILQQANSGAVVPFVLDGYSGRGAAASYGAMAASELGGTVFGVGLG